jgi:TetR/AcrR family transcriptional regulator of autoinduction and epiphytic fitness
MSSSPGDNLESDARQKNLLDASLTVFLRYGFRKTSMEEVARAARISRQGLYLHFKTKEDLFRATVRHFLSTTLRDARAKLEDETLPLPERLGAAFDAMLGRFVGMLGSDAEDLNAASSALVGNLIAEHEQSFVDLVAKCLRSAGVLAAYKSAGLSAKQLAETLYATARGLKYSARSPSDFSERMAVAIRMLCSPWQGSERAARKEGR